MENRVAVVVVVSANVEWRSIREIYSQVEIMASPYGEWFLTDIPTVDRGVVPVLFFQGGWGKISAAGSTQYIIDHWHPKVLINLGTCGGFEGSVTRGEVILADRTLVYDIYEQMGDHDAHIAHYTTLIDLSWLRGKLPIGVTKTLLVSGDRDLIVNEIPLLKENYGAIAGDWESGAIAFVAQRNKTRLLILRGVSDLVGISGGEAYGNIDFFNGSARQIMGELTASLPGWVGLSLSN
jgi:adenosylhomocysteine nucleosidase